MDDVEVRELRYFLAVAATLNFSRAAERLGIAQPPLSRAIRQLESRLDVRLFERDTRRVMLTPAGQTLSEAAPAALDVLAAAVRRAQRAGSVLPSLVVTAKPGIASGLLQQIVASYTALPDAMPVEIAVSGYRQQADMVRDGRADVALLSSPYDERGLESEPLTSEPRVAALSPDHPLARRNTLRCKDFDREPIPRWTGSTSEERSYWSGQDRELSGPSRVRHPNTERQGPEVNNETELLEVVSLAQAIALIPASLARRNARPDIVYRPVHDASPYVIAVAWPEGARASSIAAFVRAAVDLTSPGSRAAQAIG